MQNRPGFGKGLLLAPGGQGIDLGLCARPLEFIDAQGQIAQAGEDFSSRSIRGAAGILAQGDIAAIVRSVFDGRPVAANDFFQRGFSMFFEAEAGGITADFHARFVGGLDFRRWLLFPSWFGWLFFPVGLGFFGWLGQFDASAFDRDDLPAAA